jgi:hypothetical protein
VDQIGQNPNDLLDALTQELEQLLKNEALAKERATAATEVVGADPDNQRRWSMLMRDWGPDGAIAWMQDTIRLSRKPGA